MTEPTLRSLLSTGSRKDRARWFLRILTPWVIEWWLWKRSTGRAREAVRSELDARIVREPPPEDERVEEAIQFLLLRGLDEREVRKGSMPSEALRYTREVVFERLPVDRPVRALHIGNFVGVSLCYFSWLLRERHPESVVVSVDPNITHRGIGDPESHVRALLHHFGLLDSNLIVRGYTLGRIDDLFDSEAEYEKGIASETVLGSLGSLGGGNFDLVALDGEHEKSYLSREIAALLPLLATDAIVVFDDVKNFPGVAAIFRRTAQEEGFHELGQNRRVGILQRSSTRVGSDTVVEGAGAR